MDKRRIRVVSAAIMRNGCYLITQRTEKAVLPLLWEFPGGRAEDEETDAEALTRELEYRLGLHPTVFERLAFNTVEYTDYIVDLHLYRCDIGAQDPRPIAVNDVRWVTSQEFDEYCFAPADETSMNALLFEHNLE